MQQVMEIGEDILKKKLLFKLGTGDNQFERSVYLTLIRGRKNCLIDTGTAGNFDNIVNFCRENGVTVADLDLIGRGRDAGYPAPHRSVQAVLPHLMLCSS